MWLLLITSVVKPKLIVIWKLFISAIFLNCFVFSIYLLIINYGKTKSKHRLEIFATDCWKQWGCLEYSQEFAFMPLHKLSVYLKLLHNAAITKQIVKGPAFEVEVNGSSSRKPRGFLIALNRYWEREGEDTTFGFCSNWCRYALLKLTHL